MYWKIIVYVFGALLCLVLIIGVGVKLMQKTEGYKASDDQVFYSVDYHPFIGGCLRYDAFPKSDLNTNNKKIKKESKQTKESKVLTKITEDKK